MDSSAAGALGRSLAMREANSDSQPRERARSKPRAAAVLLAEPGPFAIRQVRESRQAYSFAHDGGRFSMNERRPSTASAASRRSSR